MKKIFQLAIAAIAILTIVSCASDNKSNASGSAAASDNEQVAEAQGTTFEGDNFTITYPEMLKETFKTGTILNAAADGVKLSATFSQFPCKPADFKTYYNSYTNMGMWKDYNFQEPQINDNIMTFKGAKDGKGNITYVVYLADNGGVAGNIEYPVEKEAEIEPLVMPMLKSIKLK